MNTYQIWADIIIPLLCALLGGLLTFGGVKYTIKKQEEKEKKNEKLKYKPYLKLTNHICGNEICCKDYIKDTFDQDNINFETTKHFYSFRLNTFYIQNCVAECIIKEIIIDNERYKLNESLLFSNEIIGISTTYNRCINIKNLLKNIYLVASDTLGNIYYYKCEFEVEYEHPHSVAEYENGKMLNIFNVIYTIISIGLPNEKI